MKPLNPVFIKKVCLLVLCLALAFGGMLCAETMHVKTLEIPTIEYPPLMSRNKGLMNDIVKASFDEVGVTVTFRVVPMARIIWLVSNDQAPAVLGSAEWFYRSQHVNTQNKVTIVYSTFHFFYLNKRFPRGLTYDSLSDLKNYRIGYIRSGALTRVFESAGLTPDLVSDLNQNAKKLFEERIDMHAATRLAGWAVIKRDYPDKMDRVGMVEKPIKAIFRHIIFSEKEKALMQTFKQGFHTIRTNGTYLKLLKEYYDDRHISDLVPGFVQNGFPDK